ncbi:formin-like protein 7 isoform X3 [Homalodisca vitripennis]|nr:formin-like protein 7 isoform X3 [Homalodisca vitripennis]XP_046679533.1 formin-like protein 7 isoform X3 [Homalodisca vitripennis]
MRSHVPGLGKESKSNTVKKRPGPKSRTVIQNLSPQLESHSPLKLTIKRLPTCQEPAFEVVNKKKGRVRGGSASMDDMIPEGLGGSPHPHPVHTPSPTPSDILRPEVNADSHRSTWESLAYSFGFLAPESPADQVVGDIPPVNGSTQPDNESKDSGASCNSEPEPLDNSLPPPQEPQPLQNGTSEPDSESEPQKSVEQESSDSGCEKDESEKDFSSDKNVETTTSTSPPLPANPSPVRSLTILAPSALNSSVVNGSLPPEPLDSNTVSEAFNEPGPPQAPPPVKEGLTILSPAALGATSGSVNLLNLNPSNASNDPLGMLRGYMEPETAPYMLDTCEVCGERSDNLEQHRAAMGHYKCHMSPDCAVVLFTSAAELSKHQHVTHGITPPPPPQPPQQSLEQLAQQVQRLPVPYGMAPTLGTPPPSVSPVPYRVPGGITLSYPQPPAPGPAQTPPFQGGIQARPFAMQTSPSTIRPDGSPAASPTLPPGLSRSISISPSVKPSQKRSTSSPVVEPTKRSRPDSPDCELVDVQQPVPTLPRSISLTVRNPSDANPPSRNKESSGVANILASRGITVTPAVNKASPAPPPSPRSPAQPVTTLNLSSAVTIVPASQARNQFAVPQTQGRSVSRTVDRNSRPPTVDLTQDSPPVFRRNRPQRFTCQVCDKVFTTQETLNQHLTTHRSPGKLPYKCNLCNAQYPTQQGMLQHKQTYHKEAQGSEMALPVVDIKHPGTIQKLSSLGIRHCLVLSQLGNSSGGVFGLPIVAIDNARNPAVCNLGALGASNVLSLGPAKALR